MNGRGKIAAVALALVLSAGPAAAETFTGAEVLEWSPQGQTSYFQTSIGMAGIIAAQVNRDHARCIDNWHAAQRGQNYPAILEAIRTYPAYHPQGVVLAVLQKACGAFE